MPDPAILRILDANANRAREALRTMEDVARFALNNSPLCATLKALRHDLAAALSLLPMADAMHQRDTPHDVGTSISTSAESQRGSIDAIATAAGKRLTEALRVLEESAKTIDPAAAAKLEKLRYAAYSAEKSLAAAGAIAAGRSRFASVRLYILLTDALCHPSLGGWQNTLDALLAAVTADNAPQLAIQLREKNLPDGDLLTRATIFTEKCRAKNVLSFINDRPDIALLARADGLHLGQSDLPLDAARQLLPPHVMLGLSTENLTQAATALPRNPTYLALGPMFPTTTKHKPTLATPAYAAAALQQLPPEIPQLPIGGITLENLPSLLATGIPRIALCSAIIATPDPTAAAREFLAALTPRS